jgi:hypothetical protein
MGIYLMAVDGPSIDSPDYVGTFGSSQSRVVLKLIEYHRITVFSPELEERVRRRDRDTGGYSYPIERIQAIHKEAPLGAYEFRKYAIDRGCDWLLKVSKYDDDHVENVRKVISRIAEYGQDVYET